MAKTQVEDTKVDRKDDKVPADMMDGGAKKRKASSVSKKSAKPAKKSVSKSSKSTKKSGSKKTMKAGGVRKGDRYFKLIDAKTLKSYGRYTGETPKQAASKGFTKLLQKFKEQKKNPPKEMTIYLRESTRGSNRKVYGYSAIRQKLDEPQELEIKDKETGEVKTITYQYRNKIKKVAVPEQIGGAVKRPAKKVAKKAGSKTAKKSASKKASKKTAKGGASKTVTGGAKKASKKVATKKAGKSKTAKKPKKASK